ncbi:MAG: hypothetical protein K9N07_04240 [Candidatus Cloacimonetes bacterium]|nr:hypothetical protein [Candidatus Cloacimonadota bacterium]
MKSNKTLKHYIQLRLGRGPYFKIIRSMFIKAFKAKSVREFWNYWNPVFGYYMLFYFYKPLSKKVPRTFRVVATFAVSGFLLHDLLFWWPFCWLFAFKNHFPLGTVWFVFLAIIMLFMEKIGFNTKKFTTGIRILSNLAYLVFSLMLTLLVAIGIKLTINV